MSKKWMVIVLAILLLPISPNAQSATALFPLEELRPGMKGVGKTCYQGSTPQDFDVEILGIMKGVGPGSDAVLARFSGGPLGQTGVFEGMSGSPVFIEGRLLGAVAFSFAFPKEAIGGITPINQMIDAFSEQSGGAAPAGKVLLKKSMLWNQHLAFPETSGNPFALTVSAAETKLQPALAPFSGHALLPIATPLNLSGFSRETINAFAPQFKAIGMTLLQGTGSSSLPAKKPVPSSQPQDSSVLEPGSNIVVPLIRGDLDASAGGTVTYIDGNKLYAFGHMLFDLGFTELPMHKGRVITLFPSLQSSFKILETTDPVGTIRQDRGSGIYGVIGEKARMIPIKVQMTTSRGIKRELNFEVARNRFLTPFLINLTVFNSIVASERSLGVSTLQVKGKINIKDEQPVVIENRYSSDSNTPASASLAVALPVNFLLASGYKNLDLEDIDLDISANEDDRAAVLQSIRIDRSEATAGDTVRLDISYTKSDGEVVQDGYPVKIPSDVTPGPISILVADGTSLMTMDAREQGDDLIPRDLSQLIKFMNNIRKNDRLYVRIFRREPGAVIKGEGLPALPPSVLSILRSDRDSGDMSPIQTSTYMEYEVPPSDYVVSGSKILNLSIKP